MAKAAQVVLQIGSPMDGSEGLIWSLRKNPALLEAQGLVAPRPKYYRRDLARLADRLQGAPAPTEAQENLLYAGLESRQGRVFFADTDAIGSADAAFDDGVFFGAAGDVPSWTRALFPQAEFTFLMGLCNPALLIAELVQSGSYGTYEEIVGETDIYGLRWSDVIARVQKANPNVPIILWTKEEIPFVWPQIMQAVLGTAQAPDSPAAQNRAPLLGAVDPLGPILTAEGLARLTQYLDEHPDLPDEKRLRVLEIFMEKFARPDQVAVDINIPQWDDDTFDAMTEIYDGDLEKIARLDGVTLISA